MFSEYDDITAIPFLCQLFEFFKKGHCNHIDWCSSPLLWYFVAVIFFWWMKLEENLTNKPSQLELSVPAKFGNQTYNLSVNNRLMIQ